MDRLKEQEEVTHGSPSWSSPPTRKAFQKGSNLLRFWYMTLLKYS